MTSSGIDACVKKIIWDAGRYLVPISTTGAANQYKLAVRNALSSQEKVDEELKSAVVDADPASAILIFYLRGKTKGSFQGSGDLKARFKRTLGISNIAVPDSTLESLDPLFTARNEIAHALDFEEPENATGSRRNHRSSDDVKAMCNNAFSVTADMLHAVADVIVKARPSTK